MVSSLTVEAEHANMLLASHGLARDLHKLGYKYWASEVHRWANSCSARRSALCGWSCTVKTHKADGLVTARSIHSSCGHLWNALGAVVNSVLSAPLRSLQHLCWSSDDVQRLLLHTPVGSRSIFLKYDVKEFYLSGSHD
jgi:hypothetical protein